MRIVEPLLGTRAEVAVIASSAEVVDAAEQAVLDEAARLEAIFTVFDKTSALCSYQRTGSTAVAELQTVIDLAADWENQTNRAFCPTVRPLQDLWDTAETAERLPTDSELSALVEQLKATNQVDALDLNAIAKGWIAGRSLARAFHCVPTPSSGWLSLGGDIVHRGEGSVSVGIEDPHRPYDNVAPMVTVAVSNEALATSGGARRWWNIRGRRYPKVLNPSTGQPVDRVASATVIAADGATADVLATVAIVADTNQTLELVEQADAECLLVANDGTLTSHGARFTPS